MAKKKDELLTVTVETDYPDESGQPREYATSVRVLLGPNDITFLFYDAMPPPIEVIQKLKTTKLKMPARAIARIAIPKTVALSLLDILEDLKSTLEVAAEPKKRRRKQ